MVERGRAPGAKGTAFPFSQRPQRSGPGPQKGAPARGKDKYSGGGPKPSFGAPGSQAKAAPPAGGAGNLSSPEVKPRPQGTLRLKTPAATPVADAAKPVAKAVDKPQTTKRPQATKQPATAAKAPYAKRPSTSESRPPRPQAAQRPAPSAAPPSVTPAVVRPPGTAAAEPADGPVRVSKLMAERGLCSRREADTYIERGWVFVDGERVTELGTRALPTAQITLATEAQSQQARQATILLHKPVGYVSGQPEPGFQPAVVLIRPETQHRPPGGDEPAFEPRHLKGLAPAGRLDIDSTGLLVLTQDGRIARQLIGEDSEIEKEYLVRVEGQLIDNGLKLLNHGLSLDGKPLKPARVEWLNEDQLRFVLKEGKKRQIRRMCELVGLKVVGLKRVRMGRLRLGDLPPGKWRYLKPSETF